MNDDVMLEVTVQLLRNGVVRHKSEMNKDCAREAMEPLILGALQVVSATISSSYKKEPR